MSIALTSFIFNELKLADVFIPIFEILLHLRHKFSALGTVDDAMIEAQRQANDIADGDRVVAFCIC